MDKTLQRIIDNKLIEQKQANDFEELLAKSETKSNSIYLRSIFQSEYKKLTGHNYSQFGSYISFGDEKPKPAEQTKINEELTNYLSKLKSCNLINEKQLNFFQIKINNNEFVHSLQLLPSIIEQVALKEHMNEDKLKLFADKLKSKQIVNIHYDKLLVDIEQEKLQNPIDFLNYCNKAVIINEKDYSDEPEKYLELIHRNTASIISELSFENFEFQVVLDSSISDNDSKFYDFVVSLKSNGKKYKQKSSYHLYSPSKNKYYGNKIDQQEYYKIFNKILADLQSPYRLHEVKAYQGNAVEWKVFGIIALTKEQADLLHGGGVYFRPSYESFKNKLTSKKIKEAIEEYQKLGLMDHLDKGQMSKSIETVKEKENRNLNDVLISFPEVILSFDVELGNLENPYEEIVSEYSKISHQEFNPTNISDNFDLQKETISLSFDFNNKTYETEFKVDGDWIDTRLFEYMNEVIAENKLNGQFYSLYGDGAELVYLTTEQYKHIRENKLLVFADEWESQMDE